MRPRNSSCQRISSTASGKLPPGPAVSTASGARRASKRLQRDRGPHGEARLPDQAHHPLGAAQRRRAIHHRHRRAGGHRQQRGRIARLATARGRQQCLLAEFARASPVRAPGPAPPRSSSRAAPLAPCVWASRAATRRRSSSANAGARSARVASSASRCVATISDSIRAARGGSDGRRTSGSCQSG